MSSRTLKKLWAGTPLRFIDSNIFVYHMAQDPRYGEQASKLVKSIEEGEETVTSTLIIAQVCGYLKWRKRPEVIPKFIDFILSLPNLKKIETTFMDFIQARELSTRYGINWKLWDDLVISAQMKRLDIREIYSNDIDFDRIPAVGRIFE